MRNLIVLSLTAGVLALGGCNSSRSDQSSRSAQTETAQPQRVAQAGTAQPTSTVQLLAPQPECIQKDATSTAAASYGTNRTCPMALRGTTVNAEDTSGGTSLLFATNEDVSGLRQRVTRMADMYNRHQRGDEGVMMWMDGGVARRCMMGSGMMGSGTMEGDMVMPPSTARAVDTNNGARLVLTPSKPTQLTALRQDARQMADAMGSHQCPTMETPPRGAA